MQKSNHKPWPLNWTLLYQFLFIFVSSLLPKALFLFFFVFINIILHNMIIVDHIYIYIIYIYIYLYICIYITYIYIYIYYIISIISISISIYLSIYLSICKWVLIIGEPCPCEYVTLIQPFHRATSVYLFHVRLIFMFSRLVIQQRQD